MTPHQTESTILAFFAGAILGLVTMPIIHWVRSEPKTYTTVYDGQEIAIRFEESSSTNGFTYIPTNINGVDHWVMKGTK